MNADGGWRRGRIQVAEVLAELGNVLCQALVRIAQAAVQIRDRVERVAAHVLLHGSLSEALAEQTRDLDFHVPAHCVTFLQCENSGRT